MPGDQATYRRWTGAATVRAGVVHAEMADTHHHLALDLVHDGTAVLAALPKGHRLPWTTCVVGVRGVARLAGLSLEEAGDLRRWAADRSGHCTHLLDLALLAVRHALDPAPLEYEVGVSPPAVRRRVAWLRRDGTPLLEWRLDGTAITGPPPWSGVDIAAPGFGSLLRADFPADVAEAAIVLRRACHIAGGDAVDLDRVSVAGDIAIVDGSCHTLMPDVASRAHRIPGASAGLSALHVNRSVSGERHGE